jgi:hypothetical protein
MLSFRLLVATCAAAPLVIAPTFGQAPARVRGTITAMNDGSVTIKERDGRTFTLETGPTRRMPTSSRPTSMRSRSTTSSAAPSKGR